MLALMQARNMHPASLATDLFHSSLGEIIGFYPVTAGTDPQQPEGIVIVGR
jgi:hypothetical protein